MIEYKDVNLLHRIKYKEKSKLGCILSCLYPIYKKIGTVKASGVSEVRKEEIGEYTVVFEDTKDTIDEINCRAFVIFDGTKK